MVAKARLMVKAWWVVIKGSADDESLAGGKLWKSSPKNVHSIYFNDIVLPSLPPSLLPYSDKKQIFKFQVNYIQINQYI